MALFNSTADLKLCISVSSAFDLENIVPDLRRVERDYLARYLGKNQWKAVLDAAEAADPGEDMQQLLELCRDVAANLAAWRYVAVGQVDISNAGFRIRHEGDAKTAFRWQIEKLEESFKSTGIDALETLLAFLEDNKDTFTLWAEDQAAYTLNKRFLVNSAAQFSEYYNIGGSRRTFMALWPIIRRTEDFVIEPIVGPELMKALKAQIRQGAALSDPAQQLLDYLQPALVYATISDAIGVLPLEISETGITIKEMITTEGQAARPASDPMLSAAKTQAALDAGQYVQKARAYLVATASADVFPEFFNSSLYPKTATEPLPTGGKIYGAY